MITKNVAYMNVQWVCEGKYWFEYGDIYEFGKISFNSLNDKDILNALNIKKGSVRREYNIEVLTNDRLYIIYRKNP